MSEPNSSTVSQGKVAGWENGGRRASYLCPNIEGHMIGRLWESDWY